MSMTISIDDDLKRKFAETCNEIGLSPSTAFGIFARTVVREKKIPFEPAAISEDERRAHAYEASLHADLCASQEAIEEGRYYTRDEARAFRKRKSVA